MNESTRMTDASDWIKRVDLHVASLATAENGLERGYAYLGYMLLEGNEMQYWKVHYETWGGYIQAVADKFNHSVARLQRYFLVVRDLSPTFTLAQLQTMGFTKAAMTRSAQAAAIVLPATIRAAALDPAITAKALKRLIGETLKFPDDPGDYMDLGFEFVVNAEERSTLESAIRAAMHCDPVVSLSISKAAQMKEVALRFAMEFLASHPEEPHE